ncbi:MAG: peptidylprolyl isomerase [Chloroflexi bacterium]|nr:peptidylprolyl isomerase [Chloroflexota bacterium]
MNIQDNAVVSLHYKLFLVEDGDLVESTSDGPLVYLHGHDNIIPGLERQLEGMGAGDKASIVVQPEEAYGDYNNGAQEEIPLEALPGDLDLEEGMILSLLDDQNNQHIVVVLEVKDDTVVLDFNHPLAGEALRFEVEIAHVRAASDEEIAHGHAHSGDGHHH